MTVNKTTDCLYQLNPEHCLIFSFHQPGTCHTCEESMLFCSYSLGQRRLPCHTPWDQRNWKPGKTCHTPQQSPDKNHLLINIPFYQLYLDKMIKNETNIEIWSSPKCIWLKVCREMFAPYTPTDRDKLKTVIPFNHNCGKPKQGRNYRATVVIIYN